jgi:hypothetical protein
MKFLSMEFLITYQKDLIYLFNYFDERGFTLEIELINGKSNIYCRTEFAKGISPPNKT